MSALLEIWGVDLGEAVEFDFEVRGANEFDPFEVWGRTELESEVWGAGGLLPTVGDLALGFTGACEVGDFTLRSPTVWGIGDLALAFPAVWGLGELALGFPAVWGAGELALGLGELALGSGELALGLVTGLSLCKMEATETRCSNLSRSLSNTSRVKPCLFFLY